MKTKSNLTILSRSRRTKNEAYSGQRESDNPLTKYVRNYVINEWYDYDNKTNIFKDVLEHGCQSGVVGDLTYYSDTVAFYKKYKTEINKLLLEYMSETGLYDFSELIGKRWNTDDPLATDVYNQTLLAWFRFEEILRRIDHNFEKSKRYI